MKELAKTKSAYMKELDDMIKVNQSLKEECIKKKKAIAYCRRRMNRGLPVDTERMQAEIDQEMQLYRSRNQDSLNTDVYMDEEHKAILEEQRNDYERSLEILQKTLDEILDTI